VDVCGASDPASAFQGRSVDVSGRGMQVRAAHLPELRAPVVVRFQEQGSEVLAEGEVAWRRACASGGEFGLRFTALDSRSVQTLKALCGVIGLEELEESSPEPSPPGRPLPPREVLRAETDHDTDPAPPAALGVRLHIAGLTSPLHAQIKGQGARSLEVGSQLEFLRVGRALEIEDLAYGGRRSAFVESVEVSVDQKSRVPELLVSVRYSEASDASRSVQRSRTPEPQRARLMEPQSERTLAPRAGAWHREPPSQPLPPTSPRAPSVQARGVPLPDLDRSTARELADDESEDDERDSTPPPLPMRAERAEPVSSKSDSHATKSGSPARVKEREDDPEGAVADSAEALLQRLESMLGSASVAARNAGTQLARFGGTASRGAGWLLSHARQAMHTPHRPAVPRRRTTAAPRSALRSSPLRQNPQLAVQRPRTEEASDAPRPRSSRTLLWSCLIAVLAVSLGYFARRAPLALPAAPAAARVVAATAPSAAPATSELNQGAGSAAPAAEVVAAGTPAAGAAAARPLSSIAQGEDDASPPDANDARSSARSNAVTSRAQAVSPSGDEFGQGRLRQPVIYRLRLDDVGATLRGERTPTGFEITIPGRRVLDSGAAITRRDGRIAKVSTHNSAQGTRVSFRFRETIPAYKVRLRKDVVEFWISAS
jgi:hypothetical protein